jgi:hypothetical protein
VWQCTFCEVQYSSEPCGSVSGVKCGTVGIGLVGAWNEVNAVVSGVVMGLV